MKTKKKKYNETLKQIMIERDIELTQHTKKYQLQTIDIDEYALDISETLKTYETKVNKLISTIFGNKLNTIDCSN